MLPRLFAILTVICSMASIADSDPKTEGGWIDAYEPEGFLEVRKTRQFLESRLTSWKNAPLYQRLSVIERLQPYVLSNLTCKTKDYAWKAGTHDLNRLAGRAAWAFELLLRVKLDPVEPESTGRELEMLHAEIKKHVAKYRETALADARKSEPGLSALKARYRKRIVPGINAEKASDSAESMEMLLNEWCPIQKRIADLEQIVGVPGRQKDGVTIYRFDTGFGGREYHFILKDELIHIVQAFPLY